MHTVKRIYLIVIIFTVFIGCKSKTDEVRERGVAAIKIFLNENLPNEDSSFFRLDSVNLIKIDTLTAKDEMDIPMKWAARLVIYYTTLAKSSTSLAKSKMEIADLGTSIYGNKEISKAELDEVKEESKRARAYIDSANLYQRILETLQSQQKDADNIKLKLYCFRLLVQYTKKDMTYWKDIMNIPVTLDYHVMPTKQISEDYFKSLH